MAKTQQEQEYYNKLLITQAINYKKLGYINIKINNKNCIPGQPITIGGYTPDLSANFDDTITLCEVVTNNSLNETQNIDRWKTFGKSGYRFHVIISKTALTQVKEFTKRNRINVDKYWTVKTAETPEADA